ncbi:TetR/AcrR family transcriptional regulator [Nocardia sp. CA-107356]|uniref:TetR/AcrR family transcriptional regulator n=1 Tax=Nocardia sp. CA-107356 TaxID=3239972 RepID=UPI003D9482D1
MNSGSEPHTALNDRPSPLRRFDPDTPRKGDLTRERLLDCAEALLHEMPVRDLTLELVAKNARMSRSGLYFYFDSKWALVDALIERVSAEMFQRTMLTSAEMSLEALFTQTLNAVVEGWRTHRAVLLAAVEGSTHADEATDRWRSMMNEFVTSIVDVVDREPGTSVQQAVAPLGGSRGVAEIVCWMVERNLYMLFSRPHSDAEEKITIDALGIASRRIVGLAPDSSPS